MTTTAEDIFELLRKIRYDLTAAQAKLTDATNALAALNLPKATDLECHCGLRFGSKYKLDEHTYQSHDGPVPQHWLDLEARCGFQDNPENPQADHRGEVLQTVTRPHSPSKTSSTAENTGKEPVSPFVEMAIELDRKRLACARTPPTEGLAL